MKALLSVLFLTFSVVSFSQSTGISYQAYIGSPQNENSDFGGVANTEISMQFSFVNYQGIQEYIEIHSDVLVDEYGMVNLVIGTGSPFLNSFSSINWDGQAKILFVEADFSNNLDFQIIDELPIYRSPFSSQSQSLSIVGDSLLINDGNGIDLSQLIESNYQQISLLGNILNLENGGSVDLSDLIVVQDDSQQLSAQGTVLALENGGSVDLATIIQMVDQDNQNITSFQLVGTELKVEIQNGNSQFIDVVSLATNTNFVNQISSDSLFISNLAQDSVLIDAFASIYQEEILTANEGQNQFGTPSLISINTKIDVYRNGVKVNYTIVDNTTIEVEPSATCFQDDEVRIVQVN